MTNHIGVLYLGGLSRLYIERNGIASRLLTDADVSRRMP